MTLGAGIAGLQLCPGAFNVQLAVTGVLVSTGYQVPAP
jgi:hypothetical protein